MMQMWTCHVPYRMELAKNIKLCGEKLCHEWLGKKHWKIVSTWCTIRIVRCRIESSSLFSEWLHLKSASGWFFSFFHNFHLVWSIYLQHICKQFLSVHLLQRLESSERERESNLIEKLGEIYVWKIKYRFSCLQLLLICWSFFPTLFIWELLVYVATEQLRVLVEDCERNFDWKNSSVDINFTHQARIRAVIKRLACLPHNFPWENRKLALALENLICLRGKETLWATRQMIFHHLFCTCVRRF